MCKNFPILEPIRARPKISPGSLPFSSINYLHINIYVTEDVGDWKMLAKRQHLPREMLAREF